MAGFSSGTEAFASDIEGGAVKKEKKKKKVKTKELLHHREKVHPEKIKGKCLYQEYIICTLAKAGP